MRIRLSTVVIGAFALLFVALVAFLATTSGPGEQPRQQSIVGTPTPSEFPGGSCITCA
ncbi:hypothetical protein [Symbioplanes lichenis]|uniref:hypothetical protein n=1 Tax=Symbioplanes lichenis TaxID=1629072 RepID=UPI0027398A6B|nr:hypothetical protein [Actinoplanes lichenis]